MADLADAPQPPRAEASPAAPWPGGRPEPTRAATLAAFRNALPAGAAPLAPSPFGSARAAASAPAIAPVLAVSRWPSPPRVARPTLARVQTETSADPAQNASGQQGSAAAEPLDLDAVADHVIERLRHELRDGRERLGYLLDDLR